MRAGRNLAGHPLLVGAITVLVAVVGVVLAYQAHRGLPFAPVRELRAELPDAANLVRGAEVRLGGSRVGSVERLEAVQRADGSVGARATLRLDPDTDRITAGTTVVVRPRSLLGLKYVELQPGRRGAPELEDGATLPVRQARPQAVELDELLTVFDARTRRAATASLREAGTALAGRGAALNEAIERADGVLEPLQAVGDRLAAPGSGWRRLVPALAAVAAEVAPRAEAQAGLLRGGARTFTAVDRASRALDAALATGPQTIDAAAGALPAQRPLLRELTALAGDVAPGAAALRRTSGDLAAVAREGAPGLRRSRPLWAALLPTLRRLDRFAADDRTSVGVRALTATADALAPLTARLAPTPSMTTGRSSSGPAAGAWGDSSPSPFCRVSK